MAKAARAEQAEFAGKTDEELREAIRQTREALRNRIMGKLEVYRSMGREVGVEVSIVKTGGGEPGRRGRRAGDTEGSDRRSEVGAKYRNPDNPDETWSGRGRQPKWVQAAISHGRRLEDLAIPAAA